MRLICLLDEADTIESKNGVICEFWADLTYTGMTSNEVAAGTNHSLQKFGHPSKQINGSTSAGTPVSYANAYVKIGIWHEQGISNLCGLHDLQSVFPLGMQQVVSKGGLESQNAIQFLHTIFSLYLVLKSSWKRLVSLVWKKESKKQADAR
jgi:hypothetical protein